MSDETVIRQKALWAMKAVTAGALLFAGVSCSGDADPADPEWNLSDNHASADVATTDTGSNSGLSDVDTPSLDTGGDANTGTDTEVADVGEDVSTGSDTGTDTGSDTGLDGGGTATDTGTDTEVADVGEDVSTGDTGADTGMDVAVDTGTDTAVADAGAECNSEESTGDCPEHCHMDNDVDCCFNNGGDWFGDSCGPVAVPGPFVPPAMTA